MAKISKHFYISGKVQGVFFRDATSKKANELDITGWVRNLLDGRVEVLASGTTENMDSLELWLWQGTPSSQVEHVEIKEVPFEAHSSFVVRHERYI
jgi:acylphosphatase